MPPAPLSRNKHTRSSQSAANRHETKSLAVFLTRFKVPIACRASAGGFARNGAYDDYPLYGLAAFPKLSCDPVI